MTREEQAKFERDRREHVLSVRARACGLSDDFLSGRKSLDTFPVRNDDDREAIAAVRAWLRPPVGQMTHDPNGLYIHGPVGIGKSGLAACAVASSLLFSPARYITKIDFAQLVAEAFDDDSGVSEREAVMRVAKVQRLALDDIDKGQMSEFVLRILYALIDWRYRYRLPTIITANCDQDGLYEKLSAKADAVTADAIVDRIREMCEDVPMSGESKR